jgi:septum formation protein
VLLLASASPARSRLLEQAAIPHRVQVSGVDEDAIHHTDPAQLVQLLAQAKAQAVRDVCTDASITAVLGCDSVLAFEGEVFGKPIDAAEAIARWQRMAGGWGELHTGHCLLAVMAEREYPSTEFRGDPDLDLLQTIATVTTRVQFAPLSEAEMAAYVATGEPLQCAGGFALEGRGGMVVEQIQGCFSNVIGLSLPLLRRWLAGDCSGS